MAAKNLNTRIAQALTRHDIDLLRMDADLQRRVVALLNGLEAELLRVLLKVDPAEPARVFARNNRLSYLVDATGETIDEAYNEIIKTTNTELKSLSVLEAGAVSDIVNRTMRIELMSGRINENQLKRLVDDTMIQGAPSKDWWAEQKRGLKTRFRRQLQQGILGNETIDQMVQRVRGTRAARFTDGLMQTSRREATALVRSSVLAVTNQARYDTYQWNDDVVKGVQWTSTLDKRTSPTCIALDGQAWTLDGRKLPGTKLAWRGPPPAHWNCRSTLVPVIKSFEELAGESNLARRMSKIENRAEFASTRASMDGQVAETTTYGDWLNGQPESVQREVLGAGRFSLWKSGKISATDLVDQSRQPLSVAALKEKYG